MTDETKQLFDAPWHVENFTFVVSNTDGKDSISVSSDKKTAHRLARLPELYDALMELVKKYCRLADLDCPNKNKCLLDEDHKDMCEVMPYLELLRKVRDGE